MPRTNKPHRTWYRCCHCAHEFLVANCALGRRAAWGRRCYSCGSTAVEPATPSGEKKLVTANTQMLRLIDARNARTQPRVSHD